MLEQKDVMVVCKKCKNSVPSSIIRMDLDNKMMVCQTCLKEGKKAAPAKTDSSQFQRQSSISFNEKPVEKPKTIVINKVKHRCEKCNYAFNANLETMNPRMCPYCGREVVL